MECQESQPARRKLLQAQLLRRESIGNAYHVLTFEVPKGIGALPGQFAMIRGVGWGQAPLLSRPMSYLSGGTTPSILVKVCGDGSGRLGRAEPGETFMMLGPLGNAWHPPDPYRRSVLVAGGVGIAPLLFLAHQLTQSQHRPVLLYGGRTSADLPLLEDAGELCSVKVATEDGSSGHRGRVTELLQHYLAPEVQVCACGPDPMMAAIANMCSAAGVSCEVSLEAPMACGYGVCLGCAVPCASGGYLYACVSGPCIDARNIDWSVAHRSFSDAAGEGQCP
jgi:dihydroorotate dehydrogenase electron transfer subunit